MKKTFTITEFRAQYPNDKVCLNEIFKLRFGSLKECPKCNSKFDYSRVTTKSKKDSEQRKCYQCSQCANQIYPLAGTIYEKTRTPLTYWFYAIYLYTATRNGVAAKELERQLGVTYKCAFRMSHCIRKLMSQKRECYFDGVVMIDEAYIGGKWSNKHREERAFKTHNFNKTKVLGIIQDDGKVFSKVIKRISAKEIIPIILKSVKKGSIIVTDGEAAYSQLESLGYTHVVVRHDLYKWSKGEFSTNAIEGFWSQLKRAIRGTHIKVTRKYLQRYIDESCFRHEYRKKPQEMFGDLIRRCA